MSCDLTIEPCPLRARGLRFEDLPEGWCSHCDRRVLDLSAMTARQARRALRQPDGRPACVAVTRDATGRPVFRRSRWLAVLAAIGSALAEARADTLDVRHGTREPPPAQEMDFGLGWNVNVHDVCHPGRFPHGPIGTAWVTVVADAAAAWRAATIRCRQGRKTVLRERQRLDDHRARFGELPNEATCEVTVRGALPTERIHVTTGARRP